VASLWSQPSNGRSQQLDATRIAFWKDLCLEQFSGHSKVLLGGVSTMDQKDKTVEQDSVN
jgi:hypothetical protein